MAFAWGTSCWPSLLAGSTYKLKFGHRGCNHPVKDLTSGKVNITSQNHGYAVHQDSLAGTGLVVTHTSLNDGSVEGLRHQSLPIFSVQYHPEASPGPTTACICLIVSWNRCPRLA